MAPVSTPLRKFHIGVCLGRGGFGEVYRATMASQGGIQSTVAIKVLRADLGTEDDAMRRLRDEGRLLARLHHPAILKVYDMVLLEERVTLVAEYVDGADLAEWTSRMPVRPLLQIVSGVAGALDVAYSAKGPDGRSMALVHRDIKPTNIRVGRHGEIKVLDFGIAHFQSAEREAKTQTGLVVGSLPYMAPERFGSPDVIPASDIFSLGCTLYECLVGAHFLGDGNIRSVSKLALRQSRFEAHSDTQLEALPEVDPRFESLLRAMLAYLPEERPSASELAGLCEELADELEGPSLRSWCRNQPWPELVPTDGPLVGRVIVEGALRISDGHVQVPRSGPVINRVAAETMRNLDVIQRSGPGPSLMEHPFTEENIRREVVETNVASRSGVGRWIAGGCTVLILASFLFFVLAVSLGAILSVVL